MKFAIIILLVCAAGGLAFSIAATVKMFGAFAPDFPVEERTAHIRKYRTLMIISYGVTFGLIAAALTLKLLTR